MVIKGEAADILDMNGPTTVAVKMLKGSLFYCLLQRTSRVATDLYVFVRSYWHDAFMRPAWTHVTFESCQNRKSDLVLLRYHIRVRRDKCAIV